MDTVNLTSSAIPAILRQILTKLLVAAGTWLVARGFASQQTADAVVPEVVGLLMVLGATAYSSLMAKWKNEKAVKAATSKPGDGTEIVVDGQVVSPAHKEAI